MSTPGNSDTRRASRRPEVLVAPVVTFLAVCVLLVLAKHYEKLPLRPPPCQLRTLTGIPCVGCGGTRAIKSLASWDVAAAIQFNPAITLAVFGIALWLLWRLICFCARLKRPELAWSRKKVVCAIVLAALLLLANWIYLLVYLPQDP